MFLESKTTDITHNMNILKNVVKPVLKSPLNKDQPVNKQRLFNNLLLITNKQTNLQIKTTGL